MAITFPTNPANGDKYSGYIYNSTDNAWSKVTEGDVSSTVNYGTVNDLPLTGNNPGDQVYVTGNNRLYIWNGDGWYNIALINTAPQITQGGAGAYKLADDGTPTVITLVATDPEELPITWSYSVTSGSLGNTATVSQADNVFTITPSTNSADAGTFSITFTASDGVNLSTDVNSFELAFFVEDSKYTSALITSVGGNGAVNTGLTDKNTTPKTLTVSGAVAQTFSPYNAGGYSYYFDGSGDYLDTPDSDSFELTGDFTLECWIYRQGNPSGGTYQSVFGGNGSSSNGWNIYVNGSGDGTIYFFHSSFIATSSSGVISDNQWHHISVTRSGTDVTIWVDGVSVATGTASGTLNQGTANSGTRIGYDINANALFQGYIADVRVVNGTALYTSAFTPPTERLTAVTNTSLLTCQLPYPKDSSSNDHTITVTGDVRANPFNQFNTGEYSSATHGASLYTASGQYITVADTDDLDMGTGDFTVEFWHYNVSTPGNYPSIVSGESWSNPSGGVALRFDNTTAPDKVTFFWNGIGDPWLTSSSSFRANEWMHIALTRSGNNFTLWVNGKQEATGSNTGSIDWCKGGDFHIHWGEWDGANGYVNGFTTDLRILKGTALYTAAFTPPTEPLQEITNTVLLVNGHDDAAIIDKAQSGGLVLNGNTQSSTSQTKYASSSMYFDGSGDYMTINHEALGTGDWTIEGWVYFNTTSTNQYIFDFRSGANTNPALDIQTDWRYITDGAYRISSGITPSANTWYHFAVVKYNGTTTLYINGSSIGTYSDSLNYVGNSSAQIGKYHGASSGYLNGYIEDLRITKGLARYTSSFTPPAASLEG